MKAFYVLFFLLMPIAYAAEVQELSSIPVLTPLVTDEQAYKYMNITAIPGTIIEFDVNQSWIKENRINIIYLSKYAAGKWNPIATEFTGSKEGKNTYRAKIDEHSYYAIFGKDVLGEIQVLSQTGNILSKSTNNLMLMLLLAAIILIIYWKRS